MTNHFRSLNAVIVVRTVTTIGDADVLCIAFLQSSKVGVEKIENQTHDLDGFDGSCRFEFSGMRDEKVCAQPNQRACHAPRTSNRRTGGDSAPEYTGHQQAID